MLFAVATHPTHLRNLPQGVEGVEVRLDHLPDFPWQTLPLPVMLTWRGKKDAEVIETLLASKPPFFDLEGDDDSAFIHEMIGKYPETRFLISYHNYTETPANLEAVFQQLKAFSAWGYKIATYANSALDALRLLLFGRAHPELTVIPLGERGQFGRILGPICGNPLGYAGSLKELGQLSGEELISCYRYPRLNPQTTIYGLIGDPVAHSIGHLYHNQVFEREGKNSVYVKIPLRAEEVAPFLPLAEAVGFRGLSITMPLKEQFGKDPVNTLIFCEGERSYFNTDGKGALDTIEKRGRVKGKKMVVFGAGGAARAIVAEAVARGAHVWILNRTASKAEAIAQKYGCSCGAVPSTYDIVINASAVSPSIDLIPGTLVADLIYSPRETSLLKKALERGCRLVTGEELFQAQAALQANLFDKSSRIT